MRIPKYSVGAMPCTDGMDIVDEICNSAEPTDDNGTISPEEQPVITSITVTAVEENDEDAA